MKIFLQKCEANLPLLSPFIIFVTPGRSYFVIYTRRKTNTSSRESYRELYCELSVVSAVTITTMGFPPLTTTATLAALAPRQSSLDHDGTPPVAALTTVWTAAEGCYPVSTRPATDIDMFWTSNPDCAPPGYASYFETYYYSPAICPSGFTVGCARYGDFQGPDVEPTETAMLCVMR